MMQPIDLKIDWAYCDNDEREVQYIWNVSYIAPLPIQKDT